MATPVDYRETLVTYLNQECDTKKTAEVLNISTVTLHGRIAALRKMGVSVPKSQRKTALDKIEVAQLNSIINKWKKEQ